MTWLVRHAAWLIQRYQPHNRGPTSYDLIRGTPYQGRIAEFGETVLVLDPGEKLTGGVSRMAKFSNRWAQGVWIGKAEETDEHLVLRNNRV